jgi:hypothetical protein
MASSDLVVQRRRAALIKTLSGQEWFDQRHILSYGASRLGLSKRLREALQELQGIELNETRADRIGTYYLSVFSIF